MDEFFLLQEIEEENKIAQKALKRQRRQLRDTQNPLELPENEFRSLYRYNCNE